MLELPADAKAAFARCGHCRTRFRLPEPDSVVSDDAILDWLHEKQQQGQAAQVAQEQTDVVAELSAAGDAMLLAESDEGSVRLVSIGSKGALLEFPANRLLDRSFRCAMPRRCLRCGSRAHLHAHVIIYAPQLRDSLSLEAAHSAGALVLKGEDVRALSAERLLQRLPRVPNVPPPADLPMPYYLCRMCGESGAVSGEIRVNTETGEGFCRLLIWNLEMAKEFLVGAGVKGSGAYTELQQAVDAKAENPWEVLPSFVRHRLEQWFSPKEGERFVTYVPDRDHAPTEDGVAGLVVSNCRVIHRLDRRCREAAVTDPLVVAVMAGRSGKTRLLLETPSWRIKNLAVDGEGIHQLRRGLSAAKFKVLWR
jgi:hypothetical protein